MNPSEFMESLSSHLKGIGIQATSINPYSQEAVRHSSRWGQSLAPIGCFKLGARNIDFIECYMYPHAGATLSLSNPFDYVLQYVIKMNVGDREEDLTAEVSAITQGTFRKEFVDFYWKGGLLAQQLNADAGLRDMMVAGGVPHFFVSPYKKDNYVAITAGGSLGIPIDSRDGRKVGSTVFPTMEDFQIYDKIAFYIKKMEQF